MGRIFWVCLVAALFSSAASAEDWYICKDPSGKCVVTKNGACQLVNPGDKFDDQGKACRQITNKSNEHYTQCIGNFTGCTGN